LKLGSTFLKTGACGKRERRTRMGGFVSRGKRAAHDGKSPRKDVSADAKQELAERERQLALREKEIADRQVELEEWEARLKGRDGGASTARSKQQKVARVDGAGLANTDTDQGGQPGGSSTQKSRTSLLLHLAGGLQGEGEAERYGDVHSVPTALEVPHACKQAQQTLPRDAVEARALRVFVCSSLEGEQAHMRLNAEVFPRLTNDAARRDVSLTFVDLHDELASSVALGLGLEFEVNVLDLMLRELDSCSLLIGLLADCYGPPLGAKVCGALSQRGHSWLEEEGLEEASLEEVLVRRALGKDGMAMRYSHFHLLRSPPQPTQQDVSGARPDLEHARCASEDQRSSWRKGLKSESSGRGCLGALELLVSEYPLTVSPDLDALACAVYAGLLPALLPRVA
jgi:hypothetical protein